MKMKIMTENEFTKKTRLAVMCLKNKTAADKCEKHLSERLLKRVIHNISRAFDDKDGNYIRWLNGNECIFTHPRTKNTINIRLGDDIEVIYAFLNYYKQLRKGEESGDDSYEYLAYLISRSQCPKGDYDA